MKSALCLLSGKSCARLIEMFIRQIYRDEKEGGRAGSTKDPAGKLPWARQGASLGRFQTSLGGRVPLGQVGNA